MKSLTATMRELVYWKNLNNCGCHSRSGLHFSNTIGHIIHSQSPRREGCYASERLSAANPHQQKPERIAQVPIDQSAGVQVSSARTAQRKKEKPVSKSFKEEEKSLLALTRRKKITLWAQT